MAYRRPRDQFRGSDGLCEGLGMRTMWSPSNTVVPVVVRRNSCSDLCVSRFQWPPYSEIAKGGQVTFHVPTKRTVPGGSLLRSSSFDSEKAWRQVAMADMRRSGDESDMLLGDATKRLRSLNAGRCRVFEHRLKLVYSIGRVVRLTPVGDPGLLQLTPEFPRENHCFGCRMRVRDTEGSGYWGYFWLVVVG
jgi:hypothetical protein